MSRLSLHPRREQRVPLAACTTSSTRTAASVRPGPGIAAEVLFDLRQADARDTSFAAARALLAMPMHDPSEGTHPIGALLARAEHVLASRDAACRAAFDEDRRRREDIAAAEWTDEAAGAELAENADAIAAQAPGVLAAGAGLTADVVGLALAELGKLLDEPLPGTDWAAALAAVLPVRVATLKGIER